MPNTPNASSFIPKQGPVRGPRQTATHQIHLLTIISYVTFASVMVAVVGIFFYDKHVNNQLQGYVEALDSEIGNFDDDKMQMAREFNTRLWQTRQRLSHGASVVSIFEALEGATAKSASLESLELKRNADESITVATKVNTTDFDSALFQRGVYERNSLTGSVFVKELALAQGGEEESVTEGVSFIAEIDVPVSAIPNIPEDIEVATTETATTTESTTATSTDETLEEPTVDADDNQNEL